KVDIHTISLPLKEPFIVSYTAYDTMPAIIIKVHTNTGIIGYGESVPDEHVTGESIQRVREALKEQLVPAVLGADQRSIQHIHDEMNEALVLNGAAEAAVDIACYDIIGKVSGPPVYAVLGGKKDDPPKIPIVLSMLEADVLAKQA